jgi:hypothetical protein
MVYFAKGELMNRIVGSQSIILGFILLLISVVGSIYILRWALQSSIGSNASIVASIINTIQITIFNMVYRKVAVFLTNAENQRTETEYEDSMIIKLFSFQFVNSYSSFFFLAFIAQYLQPPSGKRPTIPLWCVLLLIALLQSKVHQATTWDNAALRIACSRCQPT